MDTYDFIVPQDGTEISYAITPSGLMIRLSEAWFPEKEAFEAQPVPKFPTTHDYSKIYGEGTNAAVIQLYADVRFNDALATRGYPRDSDQVRANAYLHDMIPRLFERDILTDNYDPRIVHDVEYLYEVVRRYRFNDRVHGFQSPKNYYGNFMDYFITLFDPDGESVDGFQALKTIDELYMYNNFIVHYFARPMGWYLMRLPLFTTELKSVEKYMGRKVVPTPQVLTYGVEMLAFDQLGRRNKFSTHSLMAMFYGTDVEWKFRRAKISAGEVLALRKLDIFKIKEIREFKKTVPEEWYRILVEEFPTI